MKLKIFEILSSKVYFDLEDVDDKSFYKNFIIGLARDEKSGASETEEKDTQFVSSELKDSSTCTLKWKILEF